MKTRTDPLALENALDALDDYARRERNGRFAKALGAVRAALDLTAREKNKLAAEVAALQNTILRLQTGRRNSREAFDRHKSIFEKFRAAILACQRMKSLSDLPDLLDQLKDTLGVPEIGLILSSEEYAEFAPPGVRTRSTAAMARELLYLRGGKTPPEAAFSPFLGRVRDIPCPEFFFGGDLLSLDQRILAGSCFISPLKDKYRPERLTAVLSFFDSDPKRYAPEKVTHFLDLFCESLAGAVLDVKNHDKITRESILDELTGIHNRTYFNRHAPRLFQFAERKGFPMSLLFVDLDRFKAVNDALGHEAGDKVISAAALRIKDITRKYDVFVRLGGDEFVILAPDTDLAEAETLAARIRRDVQALSIEECCGASTELSISASVGIAKYRPGMAPEDLIREADGRMYEEKRGGAAS